MVLTLDQRSSKGILHITIFNTEEISDLETFLNACRQQLLPTIRSYERVFVCFSLWLGNADDITLELADSDYFKLRPQELDLEEWFERRVKKDLIRQVSLERRMLPDFRIIDNLQVTLCENESVLLQDKPWESNL